MWPVLQGLGVAMVYAIQRATPALLKTKKFKDIPPSVIKYIKNKGKDKNWKNNNAVILGCGGSARAIFAGLQKLNFNQTFTH